MFLIKVILICITSAIAVITLWFTKDFNKIVRIILIILAIIICLVQIILEYRENNISKSLSTSGNLNSSFTLFKPNSKNPPKLKLGDSEAYLQSSGKNGEELFTFTNDTGLIIQKNKNKIYISTLLRDTEGKVVAQIIDNEWKIKPEKTWDKNYNDNSLEIIDELGDVILQIVIIDDNTIQIKAKYYLSNGDAFGIGSGKDPVTEEINGLIEIKHNKEKLNMKIKPIFKYPSSKYLGVLE